LTLRSRLRRLRLWLAIGLAVLLGLAVIVFGVIHTPPVKRWVAESATAWLAREHAIAARIERLDYDLIGLEAELHGVELPAATFSPS